jgi:8-oxo-dGTP pyrophosphatase MutT (NUDIX family)
VASADEKNWHVEERDVVADNPWFRVLRSRVRMPDGRPTTYHILDFRKSACGIVARRPGEILLIRQYRFIIDRFVWAIPSGGVEPGEDPAVAASRELHEETGYRARSLERIHSYFPTYGCSNQEFHLFEATGLTEDRDAFDRNEVLEVRWFPEREVREMALDERIVDGLSLTPLLFLFAREGGEGRTPPGD